MNNVMTVATTMMRMMTTMLVLFSCSLFPLSLLECWRNSDSCIHVCIRLFLFIESLLLIIPHVRPVH